jgi:hypothetical protein
MELYKTYESFMRRGRKRRKKPAAELPATPLVGSDGQAHMAGCAPAPGGPAA